MGTVNVNSTVPVIELWQESDETVVYQQDTDVSFVCACTVPILVQCISIWLELGGFCGELCCNKRLWDF